MAAEPLPQWDELDEHTRRRLDRQYLEELRDEGRAGLTEEGVQRYLDYRHERPFAQITTYEQGQIRRMLHRLRDPDAVPDPVDQETHEGRIEQFGASRLHLTKVGTYMAIVVGHIVFGLLLILAYLLSR